METTYANLIRQARRGKGREWTQGQLAARMDVTAATVSRWENGHTRPNLDQMEELSRLLGIPLDSLIESGGVKLSPAPESRLYGPLVRFLGETSLREQQKLYEFLAETRPPLAP